MTNSTMAKRSILLKELSLSSDIERASLLAIRNHTDVRKWMFTEHIIGVEEHTNWIEKRLYDESVKIFLVIEKHVIGLLSFSNINALHKTTEWAFYIDPNSRGGLGSVLEIHAIDFAFEILGMEKMNCEVIEGNSAVLKLHSKFGFEEEGFRKSNIIKGVNRIGVHLLGLTQEKWVLHRPNIYDRYQTVFDSFELDFIQK